jgi:hypothetical protein
MLEKLKQLHEDLKSLKRDIQKETNPQVAKKGLRERAEQLGTAWFSEFVPAIRFNVGAEVLEPYNVGFKKLIKLSAPNNQRTSYLAVLSALTKKFRDELILPQQQSNQTGSASLAVLTQVLGQLPNQEEDEYLQEAVRCARQGFLRASIVLGWCAAIDRIHRKIEATGFASFNVASAQMASQQQGRFKRFNSVQNVSSLNELRTVFDTVVLWIIEGMGWVDSNQHTRLTSCFDMRCHCAHPGEAPITEFNLMSFFSDINEIVLRNPKFELTQASLCCGRFKA